MKGANFMHIKHEHPAMLEQEQYDQELRRAFTACIRKLRQIDGRVPIGGMPHELS